MQSLHTDFPEFLRPDLHVLETAPYVPPKERDDGTAPDAEGYDEGDLVWSKIVAGGTAPEPRSNHSCSLVAVPASSANKMLCVLGTDFQKYSLLTVYKVNVIGHSLLRMSARRPRPPQVLQRRPLPRSQLVRVDLRREPPVASKRTCTSHGPCDSVGATL